MNIFKTSLAVAALAFASSASAATFDFVSLAGSMGEQGGNPLVFTDSGVTLEATGTGSVTDVAYLDGGAGLGVCSTGLDASLQCIVPSDDNVTLSEVLTLTISGADSIKGLTFKDTKHRDVDSTLSQLVSGDTIWYQEDGNGWMSTNFGALSAMTLMGHTFDFKIDDNNNQFYISSLSAVPVPAAALLFGSALLGMLGFGRRKDKSENALAA